MGLLLVNLDRSIISMEILIWQYNFLGLELSCLVLHEWWSSNFLNLRCVIREVFLLLLRSSVIFNCMINHVLLISLLHHALMLTVRLIYSKA